MIPAAAVGRTAAAVGGLADSGVVVRLTRSRAWIGIVAALLVGIVGLNVYALSLSATGSRVAQRAEGLARENSALRAQLSERLSNESVQGTAGKLGIAPPAPDAIRYLEAGEADAKAAAKRLLSGRLAAPAAAEPAEPVVTDAALTPVDAAPIDPAAATVPAAPTGVDPAAATAVPAPAVPPTVPTAPAP